MFINQRYQFSFGDMVILTDDNPDPRSKPTKEIIIRAMKWLVKDARPHDSLFFHYSGHGSQSVDLRWDNVNGYDDTICPVDFPRAGQINSEV
jgi:metacaspase-1